MQPNMQARSSGSCSTTSADGKSTLYHNSHAQEVQYSNYYSMHMPGAVLLPVPSAHWA
jgi:hypothetical protein